MDFQREVWSLYDHINGIIYFMHIICLDHQYSFTFATLTPPSSPHPRSIATIQANVLWLCGNTFCSRKLNRYSLFFIRSTMHRALRLAVWYVDWVSIARSLGHINGCDLPAYRIDAGGRWYQHLSLTSLLLLTVLAISYSFLANPAGTTHSRVLIAAIWVQDIPLHKYINDESSDLSIFAKNKPNNCSYASKDIEDNIIHLAWFFAHTCSSVTSCMRGCLELVETLVVVLGRFLFFPKDAKVIFRTLLVPGRGRLC